MKFFLNVLFICTILISSSNSGFAQLSKGFNPQEAKEMIALCNSYTYLDLYGDDRDIIPKGYEKIYTSKTMGMDNKFQVYTNGKVGVINFRGSTDKKSSWLENIYSAMIPVEGKIIFDDRTFNYKFGKDTASNIHSGYTLGLAYLHEDLMHQLDELNKRGIHDIILTGHSQGGALAILTRAFLAHSPQQKLSGNTYKVYTFAQPMVGNKEFVREYDALFCQTEMSYSMINPMDAVPNMPLSYNDSTYLKDNIMSLLFKKDEFDGTKMLKDGLLMLFKDKLSGTVSKFGAAVGKQIENELGKITLPEPTGEINFKQVGNIISLPPPEYPLELKDPSILSDKEFLKTHPRDRHGVFEDKSLYKKTSMNLHHKPYNYYTAVLKVYFPREYRKVKPKLFGA